MVTCWERADLLALLYAIFAYVFVTFPYGVLGQVWYLIVWIPGRCLLFLIYLMHKYAKFDQNISFTSRVMSMVMGQQTDSYVVYSDLLVVNFS